ncbi:hypothetical protein OAT84_00045 [Gammaproteobacteria bacterium]|nr:hypothetical protein [Gammaproteobacteria bacterium]
MARSDTTEKAEIRITKKVLVGLLREARDTFKKGSGSETAEIANILANAIDSDQTIIRKDGKYSIENFEFSTQDLYKIYAQANMHYAHGNVLSMLEQDVLPADIVENIEEFQLEMEKLPLQMVVVAQTTNAMSLPDAIELARAVAIANVAEYGVGQRSLDVIRAIQAGKMDPKALEATFNQFAIDVGALNVPAILGNANNTLATSDGDLSMVTVNQDDLSQLYNCLIRFGVDKRSLDAAVDWIQSMVENNVSLNPIVIRDMNAQSNMRMALANAMYTLEPSQQAKLNEVLLALNAGDSLNDEQRNLLAIELPNLLPAILTSMSDSSIDDVRRTVLALSDTAGIDVFALCAQRSDQLRELAGSQEEIVEPRQDANPLRESESSKGLSDEKIKKLKELRNKRATELEKGYGLILGNGNHISTQPYSNSSRNKSKMNDQREDSVKSAKIADSEDISSSNARVPEQSSGVLDKVRAFFRDVISFVKGLWSRVKSALSISNPKGPGGGAGGDHKPSKDLTGEPGVEPEIMKKAGSNTSHTKSDPYERDRITRL